MDIQIRGGNDPLNEVAGAQAELASLRQRLAHAERALAARDSEPADAVFVRSVLASSPDCIKVMNLDAVVIYINDPGLLLLGACKATELIGRVWPEMWDGEARQAAWAAVDAARAGERGRFQGSTSLAGAVRWWDVRVTPIAAPGAVPQTLLAISRDITQARLADDALREAQGLNMPILNSGRDCTVVIGLDATTLYVSPGGIEAMEITDLAATLGQSWLRVWHGEDLVHARAAVAAARAGGVGRFEGFCPTHAGTPKWWDVMISPLPGPDGRPERLVTIGRDITGRRQADDRARRLAGLVEQSRDLIGVADTTGRVLYLNAAGSALLGLSPADALGHLVRDFIVDGGQPSMTAPIMLGLARNGFWEGELDFRHFGTGERLPVLFNVFPLHDAQGALAGYGTVTRDLREARRAKARRTAMLELGEQVRNLDDTAAVSYAAAEIVGQTLGVGGAAYGTIEPDGEHLVVEAAWSARDGIPLSGRYRLADFGLSAEHHGEAVMIGDCRQDVRTTQGVWTQAGAAALVAYPVLEQGSAVAVMVAIDGAPRAWLPEDVAFIRNVAERARAGIERRRAEQSLRALAASLARQVVERTADRNRLWTLSADIMLVADFSGTIVAVNPAWTTVLGWTEAELVGSDLFMLIHPDDLVDARFRAAGLAAGGAAEAENRWRRRDGEYRWISWSTAPGDGMIHAVGRDVTAERLQAGALLLTEERLRHSQKMEAVGQLTGGLAHDFNNLLTGISGSLELIGGRIAKGRHEGIERLIVAAQGDARRAAALTHRLLAFSRRQTLDARPTQVNDLVAEIEELIGRTVGPAVAMSVASQAETWLALVDPNKLENALLNMCINARDAMPAGGRLRLETGNFVLDAAGGAARDLPAGEYVGLSVADTGMGMTPDVMARAFDPFFTTKPLGQGTGLGLSMIYGFTRQSGGQVWIDSVVGEGTTVTLYLPRYTGVAAPRTIMPTATRPAEAGAAEAGPTEAGPAATTPATRETVLVVDDEPTVLMLLIDVLTDLGYLVRGFSDGAAGLAALREAGPVDLLVTDVGLPGGMDGRQLADAGRKLRPTLKVLFVTGYAEAGMLDPRQLEAGMQVLTKPFVLTALEARVRDLLASR